MTSIKQTALTIAALLLATTAQAADWNLAINIATGTAKTGVVIGINQNATDGFDAGLDSPTPFTEELLNAYFSHPEWNQTSAGKPVSTFHRDIRNSIPQSFDLTVKTSLSPVTVTWDAAQLPTTLATTINCNGTPVNMQTNSNCTFSPTHQTTTLAITIAQGDTTPPNPPANLTYAISNSTLNLTWDANQETDLAGYKLHLLDEQGITTRTINLKNVTNYNLMNIQNDVPYRLAVSAYDTTGNESAPTAIQTATNTVPQTTAADGDMDGDGNLSIIDALKVLRLAIKLDTISTDTITHGDLNRDGKITVADALILIRKVVGLK